jgi:GNAT superfamily N-acetyltransferase
MTEQAEPPPEAEVVDLRQARDDGLMEAFYTQLYLPAFPIPSEREDPDIWRSYLYGERRDGPCEVHFLIVGSHLAEPARRGIGGGLLFAIYPRSACVLLTYLVVDPALRGQGVARRLFEVGFRIVDDWAARHGRPIQAVLGELNDPRVVGPERDVIDPWERLLIAERLGARVVDLPYTQPELQPGQGRCDNLLLVAFPLPGRSDCELSSATLSAFLLEFYTALGVADPATDPDLQRTLRALSQPTVALLRPSSLRPIT